MCLKINLKKSAKCPPMYGQFLHMILAIGLHDMFHSLVINVMRGDILPWRGTVCPSVDCPGGHCTLVQNVRGDIVH